MDATSNCSNTNPFVVDDENPGAITKVWKHLTNKKAIAPNIFCKLLDALSKERAPEKRMKEKNNENKYSQDQSQENEAGHGSEQKKEENERPNDEISESYLMNNKKSEFDISHETEKKINNKVLKNNIEEFSELIMDNVEESNNMDIDVEKETIECFD